MGTFVTRKFQHAEIMLIGAIPEGFDFRYNRKWYRKISEKEAVARIYTNNTKEDFLIMEDCCFDMAAVTRADFQTYMKHYVSTENRDFE